MELRLARNAKSITASLTGRNIEHIPVVLFWWNWQVLFGGDERFEQPDGGTVNMTGNKSHPNTLVPGQALQIDDEIASFFLCESDLAIRLTRN